MTYEEQLSLWVDGKSIHGAGSEGVCCPDFSCCRPELLAPRDVREVFAAAHRAGNESVTMRMLMTFLGNAFANKAVYIAGLETSRMELEVSDA